jgi:hypothetical protein
MCEKSKPAGIGVFFGRGVAHFCHIVPQLLLSVMHAGGFSLNPHGFFVADHSGDFVLYLLYIFYTFPDGPWCVLEIEVDTADLDYTWQVSGFSFGLRWLTFPHGALRFTHVCGFALTPHGFFVVVHSVDFLLRFL